MRSGRPCLLHLVGSAVDPFFADLSVLYARDCLSATASVADAVLAHISPDRSWRFPDGLGDAQIAASPALSLADALSVIESFGVDAMVPHMFCRPGMTVYRGLFELLGMPFLGNQPEVMALGLDKAHAKAIVAAAGVAVPAGEVVSPGAPAPDPPQLPVVVKPVDGDNSSGVSLVQEARQLPAAITTACAHGRAALIERYVPLGRELRCGILERDGELVVLPLEEYAVDSETKPIRDAADKLARGGSGSGALSLVAKDTEHAWIVNPADPVCEAVGEAARRAYAALGCRHYGLFDFRVDPEGRPWFLEAGLYCSFARQSVLATMAAAAGIAVDELLLTVCHTALHERSPS